jgi:hypothetical protein
MTWRSIAKFVDRGAQACPNRMLRDQLRLRLIDVAENPYSQLQDQVGMFIKAANAGQIYPWTHKPFVTKEYVKRSGTMQTALNEIAATANIATPCHFHAYSQDRPGPLLQPVLFTRTWIQARPWDPKGDRLFWISVLQVFDRANNTDRRLMKHLESIEHYPCRRQIQLYEAAFPLLPLKALWFTPPLGPYSPTETKDIRPVFWVKK